MKLFVILGAADVADPYRENSKLISLSPSEAIYFRLVNKFGVVLDPEINLEIGSNEIHPDKVESSLSLSSYVIESPSWSVTSGKMIDYNPISVQ